MFSGRQNIFDSTEVVIKKIIEGNCPDTTTNEQKEQLKMVLKSNNELLRQIAILDNEGYEFLCTLWALVMLRLLLFFFEYEAPILLSPLVTLFFQHLNYRLLSHRQSFDRRVTKLDEKNYTGKSFDEIIKLFIRENQILKTRRDMLVKRHRILSAIGMTATPVGLKVISATGSPLLTGLILIIQAVTQLGASRHHHSATEAETFKAWNFYFQNNSQISAKNNRP